MKRRTSDALAILALCLCAFLLDSSLAGTKATVMSAATVTIWGEIQPEDVALFKQSLENSPTKLVVLNSKGGDAFAAMAIGRMVREHQLHTTVFSKCFGSCALIYIAGEYRFNSGTIGLQRPYLGGASPTPGLTSDAILKIASAVKAYVSEMGISDEFTNIMLSADDQIVRTYDSKNDIQKLVPTYDPIYKEAMDAYSARVWGLTVQEYQRRAKEVLSCGSMRNRLREYENCRGAILWGMSVATYQLKEKQSQSACNREHAEFLDRIALGEPELPGFLDSPVELNYENCHRIIMLGR